MHLRNTVIGDEAASEQIDKIFRSVFAEDKSNLESIEKRRTGHKTGVGQDRSSTWD